jgi:SAM-dependent methyltransferase
LQCRSPEVIANLLFENIKKNGGNASFLKILDFGAGNGLVAESLQKKDPELIVGIDILEAARDAAKRDRNGGYENYYVTDLAAPNPDIMDELRSFNFNTLVSVAALGFDHIPPKSFINAFNLIEINGWIAFNLRDKFLTKSDGSGFRETLNWMKDDVLEILDEKTYTHRLSVSGEPIKYTAIVGRKMGMIQA